jgi:hypothetical protein
MSEKCSCCGTRDADLAFPGITELHRPLAGRPISTRCSLELGSARLMAERIRARDADSAKGVKPADCEFFIAGRLMTPVTTRGRSSSGRENRSTESEGRQ